ncbi:MAG: hypothetical protein Ct9H90mP14_2650 [Methanobacteriota archaeon]|nr:MAG: hypothetical protein Ct9H90mP14_2650 [Euryarchaeota archaeon]
MPGAPPSTWFKQPFALTHLLLLRGERLANSTTCKGSTTLPVPTIKVAPLGVLLLFEDPLSQD